MNLIDVRQNTYQNNSPMVNRGRLFSTISITLRQILPMKSICFSVALVLMSTVAFAQTKVLIPSQVYVMNELVKEPEGVKLLGKIKVGDGLSLYRSYGKTLMQAKQKARDLNGNIMKIYKMKSPNALSSNYRIYAHVYHADDLSEFINNQQRKADEKVAQLLPSDATYALLYLYRPPGAFASLVINKVNVGDTLYKMRNGSKLVIKVPKGRLELSSKTYPMSNISIDVVPGKVYFVRCNDAMMDIENNDLELVKSFPAWQEYNGYEGRKKKDFKEDDIYR